MFNQIYEEIKKYNKIVIARHIGPDPDAIGSQIALRETIKETFPEKEVYAVGHPVRKFSFLGNLDKFDETMYDALLIVTDVPNKVRVDIPDLNKFTNIIKIDHHPFMDKFGELEYIDVKASSVCEIIAKMIYATPLKMNQIIAENLYTGIIGDTDRFLFESCSSETLFISSKLLKEDINKEEIYANLYARPFKEIKFKSFLINNFKLTVNGLAYNIVSKEDLEKYDVDVPTPANMINDFNNIEEFKIWTTITEDNGIYRVSVRSKNIVINDILEHFNGGGHIYASGARIKEDDINNLLNELDKRAKSNLQ